MIDAELLSRYKDLRFYNSPCLFEPDLSVIQKKVCPLCLCRLYPMFKKPFYYCRSKKHKEKFIVHKDKIDKKDATIVV